MENFQEFYKIILYNFRDENLLKMALTHPSLNTKSSQNFNYERLEFLGDKVLSLVIGEYLMKKFPNENEGNLSKRHASLVSGATLAQIATKINLPKMLILSFGEKKIGGNNNKNNLENALEALIGAIYLDANFLEAQRFILNFWQDFFDKNILPPQDCISELQELIQAKSKKLPRYFTEKKGGLDHQPIFISTLEIEGVKTEFYAEGNSKKEAQKNVAQIALDFLKIVK
jgi:ribonuclease-3